MKMKKLNIKFKTIVLGFLGVFTITSCTDLLNPDAKDVLSPNEVYTGVDDADAVIRGIYGKMMDVATQYVVLNELRADLMDVTSNAGLSLIELSQHKDISADNEWAKPTKIFALINTCNNAAENFKKMYADSKIDREQFNLRYSEAIAIRTWTYLQLSLHFNDAEKGGVPYFTEAFESVDDISPENLNSYPYLDLEVMIDTLVNTMEQLPFLDRITDEDYITSISTYYSRYMYIDKEYLLGELYLWDGRYHQAAMIYKSILDRGTYEDSGNPFDRYKIPYDATATLSNVTSHYNSGYARYYGNDRLSVRNKWPLMFMEIETSNYRNEWIWVLYYDKLNEQNPFIDLFSKDGGNYLLKPSQVAINNWDSQVQRNEFHGDFRGNYAKPEGFFWVNSDGEELTTSEYTAIFGLPGSYAMDNGDPVIMKYIYNYSEYNQYYDPTDKSGRWFLWRAGGLHLHYCEAANRDGEHKIAYALMNNGITANYPGPDSIMQDGVMVPLASNDYRFALQTFKDFPYDFDARHTGSSDNPPGLYAPWFRNIGIRNRVSLQNRTVESDSLAEIETHILDESALELAFEGERWGDLVRLSIRNNDNSILADRIAEKLKKSGLDGEAVRTKLMNRENWFLPL